MPWRGVYAPLINAVMADLIRVRNENKRDISGLIRMRDSDSNIGGVIALCKERNVSPGVDTSIRDEDWDRTRIYSDPDPDSVSSILLPLTEEQIAMLRLFAAE